MRRQWSAALIAVAILAAPAMAAERNYTIRGDGWFDTGNLRYGRLPMREARLTLRDNGEFAVTLFVRNERYLVRGRWDRNNRSDIERIDINDAFGQRASGNGSLAYRFRGGQPVRLELDGRTNDGTFRASIADVDEGTWDRDRNDRRDDFDLGRGNRLARAINTVVSGNGTLRLSGIRDGRLEDVRVRMGPDRDVRLEFSQPTRGIVHAEIVEVRDNRVTARVSDVYGRRASGEIQIVMRSWDMVDRINGSGRSDDGGWQLDFDGRTRREGNRDDGRWNDGRDDGWFGGRRELDERGNGWLRQDIGPDLSFDRVRVQLEGDRDAVIRLDGRRNALTLRGRWSGLGDVVRVELAQVNEKRARGVLELRRDGNRLRLIEGDGRTDQGRFEVRFSR